ncbi:Oligopeptide transporter [Thalictrum thalictroides]|uniref:Oligopeptide transporter n=1 Tax=Thalictrum thalictroides TaxID=46969 RepID=A0A7J6WIW2_THATH|nr:Oligopeptide transporter [Thalictrum thalictroides]
MKAMEIEEVIEENGEEEEEECPIEEVRLTVKNTDDPSLPVWTFRMWFLGIISCILLSFINQFFAYRTEPLIITQISVQIIALPIGQFMAAVLPTKKFHLLGFGSRDFSLNPGPFNIKEHVLISIFANAGAAFGGGNAYAIGIVNIIKAFYKKKISFLACWLLVITTQVLGYGWAGLIRKYVIDPAHMWWPGVLPQVSLFQALHEKEERRMSRAKFFMIVLVCSFCYAVVPGYLFPTISSISWVCWVWPKSVNAQLIGSGMQGLGLGAFPVDWSVVVSFLSSPLVSPLFATVNIAIGYALVMYLTVPIGYWKMNWYSARSFPIFSSDFFTSNGQKYDVASIVNDKFQLDLPKYEEKGQIRMSMFFALTYGFSFAAIAATISHVCLFYGRDILHQTRASYKGKADIHTKLMKKYKDIPGWWFYLMLLVTFVIGLVLCTVLNDQIQMQWWGLLLACALAFMFTLPISIITATTNQTPGLNVITEYLMGYLQPGQPITNVCFKTYGYISMGQAVSFLSDFKLGHYMKIPPRSMFLVQLIGTVIAGTINISVGWYLLTTIPHICERDNLPPDSPWTCPGDRVFFDASVLWGLIGPKRIFGSLGTYSALNWFFLGGLLGPVVVWLLHKAFPKKTWISKINLPIIMGATADMPPATSVNFNSWIVIGIIFNYYIFRYCKQWWQRYNYILSAGLDAGVAFMGVLLFFTLGMHGVSINWWGTEGEHCPLASCPTAKGIVVDGCPVY